MNFKFWVGSSQICAWAVWGCSQGVVPGPRDTRGAALLLPAADCLVNSAGLCVVNGTRVRTWEGVERTHPSRVEEIHTCGTAELASGLILVLGTSEPGTLLKVDKEIWQKNTLPTPCSPGMRKAPGR